MVKHMQPCVIGTLFKSELFSFFEFFERNCIRDRKLFGSGLYCRVYAVNKLDNNRNRNSLINDYAEILAACSSVFDLKLCHSTKHNTNSG